MWFPTSIEPIQRAMRCHNMFHRMETTVFLLSIVCVSQAQQQFFPQTKNTTWAKARRHCQLCFKELTTVTHDNTQHLVQNLSTDSWVGLRKNLSGGMPWSQWSNGDKVTFQNWYPGRPAPKKEPPKVVPEPEDEEEQCPELKRLLECMNATFNSTNWANVTVGVNSSANATRSAYTTHSAKNTVPATPPVDDFIEDPCVALLSFGMWWERDCFQSLPFICYDDLFIGKVAVSTVTLSSANVSWAAAPANITHYRVEVTGNGADRTAYETSLTLELNDLIAGTCYSIQVFAVKCGRDLNPQKISFYTKPDVVGHLMVVKVTQTSVSLNWTAPAGNHDGYSVKVAGHPSNSVSCSEESGQIENLISGELYNFSVIAEVEDRSISGDAVNISAYTKPSEIQNLKVGAPESTSITVHWDPPTGKSLEFRVEVWNTTNIVHKKIVTDLNLSVVDLTPGTVFNISVVTRVGRPPDTLVEGEPVTTKAFTKPGTVFDLRLESDDKSINASWVAPLGNFQEFRLNLVNSMGIVVKNKTQSRLQTSFTGLKAAANYTVEVYTRVAELESSLASSSIFTYPVPPGPAEILSFNESHIELGWGVPEESVGVPVTYKVYYSANFWKHSDTREVKNDNFTTFSKLKSGTKYDFNVTVLAGDEESRPVSIFKLTTPTIRTVTLMMLCSSMEALYCERDQVQRQVLDELKGHFSAQFGKDDVFWKLKLKEKT